MNDKLKTERIHSLDALRATLMILGIVLHSTETYSVGYDGIWPRDPNSSHLLMNLLNSFIHLFRMPAFFLIAGFFAALLFYERGAGKMLSNRVKRIVLPFLVFLVVLHPIIILTIRNTVAVFDTQVNEILTSLTLFPQITYHLWFLYYLIMITTICFLLALVLKGMPGITIRIKHIFEWLVNHRIIFFLVFSIITFAMLVWMWEYWASTPLRFIPDVKLILFYGMFYLQGWLLYKSKHLLTKFMEYDWLLVISGTVLYTLKFIYKDNLGDIAYGGLNAVLIWCFIFGLPGLFMRYFSNHSARGRYVSDASYWVYLVHLPLTVFIPGLIANWPIPALVKFLVVMTATTLLCFVSYHYLVRPTFIGAFLNGRKYPIGKKP